MNNFASYPGVLPEGNFASSDDIYDLWNVGTFADQWREPICLPILDDGSFALVDYGRV